jgi:acyl carrier protein
MELNDFVNNFADQLEGTDRHLISGKTEFRSIEEWSSFVALTIIAMVDSQYNIKITGEDIKRAVTIEDLYKIVISRK